IENNPRALIQFLHAKGEGRPFGGHLDLGTRSYVRFSGDAKILAVAAENDWRTRRWRGAQDSVSGANEGAAPASASTASCRSRASTAGSGASGRAASATTE